MTMNGDEPGDAALVRALAFMRAAAAATYVFGRETTVEGETANTVTCAFGNHRDAMAFAAAVRLLMPPERSESESALSRSVGGDEFDLEALLTARGEPIAFPEPARPVGPLIPTP